MGTYSALGGFSDSVRMRETERLSPQCELRLTTKGWIVGEKVGLTNKERL